MDLGPMKIFFDVPIRERTSASQTKSLMATAGAGGSEGLAGAGAAAGATGTEQPQLDPVVDAAAGADDAALASGCFVRSN